MANTTSSQDISQQAKEQAKDAAQEAKQQAQNLANEAQARASTQVDEQTSQAANQLGDVTSALHQTADQLRDNNQEQFAQYVNQAADQVEQIQGYLADANLEHILTDARDLARRQPQLFIGGAFTAGLLIARFLKSSDTLSSNSGFSSGSNFGSSTSSARYRSTQPVPRGRYTTGRVTGTDSYSSTGTTTTTTTTSSTTGGRVSAADNDSPYYTPSRTTETTATTGTTGTRRDLSDDKS